MWLQLLDRWSLSLTPSLLIALCSSLPTATGFTLPHALATQGWLALHLLLLLLLSRSYWIMRFLFHTFPHAAYGMCGMGRGVEGNASVSCGKTRPTTEKLQQRPVKSAAKAGQAGPRQWERVGEGWGGLNTS